MIEPCKMINGIDLKFLSLNVRGINNFIKRQKLFTWFKKSKADIIFIQETYSSEENEKQWINEWGGHITFSHGTKHSKGSAILIKKGRDISIVDAENDLAGRYNYLELDVEGTHVKILNIYAPNHENQQIQFYKNIQKFINRKNNENEENIWILGGDFNIAQEIIDRKGGLDCIKKNVIKEIDGLKDFFNLHDAWRIKNPLQKRFTWRRTNPIQKSRIDFFLTSDLLFDAICKTDIIPSIGTDHSAIIIEFKQSQQFQRGKGYWKFNSSLVNDESYVKSLKENIENWRSEIEEVNDSRLKWEYLKYKIRDFTIIFSKSKHKQINEAEKYLTNNLKILEEKIDLDDEELVEYNEIKSKLEEHISEKTRGSLLRSKTQWYEEGEKSTKYFFNLEKRNADKKHIKKLISENGNIISNPTEILKAEQHFYRELYSSRKSSIHSDEAKLFFDQELPQLSNDQKLICDNDISIKECYDALLTFKNNKSPGNDGLTSEFYKSFWETISNDLIQCINDIKKFGSLTHSQKQAVITLIEKKGKDRLFLKNWRPISLLNVDYKIITKVLAIRLKQVLPEIIHSDQTAYIKDRNITDTLRKLIDIIDYTKANNIQGI